MPVHKGGFQGMGTAKVKGCGPVKQSLFQLSQRMHRDRRHASCIA